MSTEAIKFYTSKDKEWIDSKGYRSSYSRLSKYEREKEKLAKSLFGDVLALSEKLEKFKERAEKEVYALYEQALAERGAEAKKSKGNWKWTNFEGTFMIERSVQDKIVYDAVIMEAAKQKLDDYIQHVVLKGVDMADNPVVDMVNNAFTTTKGDFDNKEITRLLKMKNSYKGEKHTLLHEGCDLITSAAKVDGTTPYLRFYVKEENSKWRLLNLNFSSI